MTAAAILRGATSTPPPQPHVARVWHGQVPAAKGDEYQKYLYENGVKKLRAIPANLGVQMFRRAVGDRADFVVISYWPSEDSIRAWAGENVTRTRLLPRDREFLIDPEMEVKHYAIETSDWSVPPVSAASFELTSPGLKEGDTLPDSTMLGALDCHGPNRSPALEWKNPPAGAQSYVIVLDDYEARGGDGFIHWAAYNIPASVTSLAENAGAADPDLAGGGRHAYNDFLKRSYGGPCPPEGPPHKYRFTVYALDMASIDDAGTPMTWRKLRFIIKGHVLAQASLTTLRGH